MPEADMHEADVALRLAETLLPGGAGFPAFTAAEAGPLLMERLPTGLLAGLLLAIVARGGPPIDPAGWTDAAARLDAVEPALFTEFRKQAYLAYYEQPNVIAAIRALGHSYNESPLPDGYPTAPFDPASDMPRHGRGRWTNTEDVRPVDVAGLDLECLR